MLKDGAERHYEGETGRRYHHEKRAIPASAFAWLSRLRAEKIRPYIRETDTVLEYGVGFGWNLAQLKCQRKLGFDIADFLEAGLTERSIEFVRDTRVLAEASIDTVICHHTLEHTLRPGDALMEMRRLLRPDGRLLLFVPFEKERRYRRFDPVEPNHHLYSWNVQTLGNLVAEMGFKLIEGNVEQFGYDRFAAVWADRLRLGETGFRFLRNGIHLIKPGLEVRVVATRPALQFGLR
jgi:SAM-dependent methyltransferase